MKGVLLEELLFRPAGEIDAEVPDACGVYAIRLSGVATLPEPFETLLAGRQTRLIYVGKATSLAKRMLGNELRGRGHGTFFRSIGAVLGHRPLTGSLATKANRYKFSFQNQDRDAIIEWINSNLEVNWAVLPRTDVRTTEAMLISDHTPLLNLNGNPRALAELDAVRELCRSIASRPAFVAGEGKQQGDSATRM